MYVLLRTLKNKRMIDDHLPKITMILEYKKKNEIISLIQYFFLNPIKFVSFSLCYFPFLFVNVIVSLLLCNKIYNLEIFYKYRTYTTGVSLVKKSRIVIEKLVHMYVHAAYKMHLEVVISFSHIFEWFLSSLYYLGHLGSISWVYNMNFI